MTMYHTNRLQAVLTNLIQNLAKNGVLLDRPRLNAHSRIHATTCRTGVRFHTDTSAHPILAPLHFHVLFLFLFLVRVVLFALAPVSFLLSLPLGFVPFFVLALLLLAFLVSPPVWASPHSHVQ
jgi:hypothetical protein